MSTPSAWEAGAALGSSISGAVRQSQDTSALDQILSNSLKTGNPADYDSAVRQVLSRVSKERQPVALQLLEGKKNQILASQKKQQAESAYKSSGLDPNISALDPSVQKEVIKAKAPKKPTTVQNRQINKALDKLDEAPEKLTASNSAIADLKELRDITKQALPGLLSYVQPELRNRYAAIRNKISREKGSTMKGVLSDKDLAFIMAETGDIGAIGGAKVYDRLIKQAEEAYQSQVKSYKQLAQEYKDYGVSDPTASLEQQAKQQIQPKQLPNGTFEMFLNGERFEIPAQYLDEAIKQGYKDGQ